MSAGKSIRIERLFNRNTRKSVMVPMDHGVSVGPIAGIEDLRAAVSDIADGGADAVIGHRGLIRCGHRKCGRDLGLIMHLSSSTDLSPLPNRKCLTASVEDAVANGADGVSVHVNLGDPNEYEMLKNLGEIASSAERWGMPLMVMIYGRGPKIANSLDAGVVAHCARVAVELGADIVKVNYTGDMESFSRVTEGCCVPVLIAGGPKTSTTREFLQMVKDSLMAGGAGLSVGRNVFQHKNPGKLVAALRAVVHDDVCVDTALTLTGEIENA